MATNAPWPGQWVADRLGITLHGDDLPRLLGLALRRNPKRAHLLVSSVLGKHVPQHPGTVYGHGFDLGRRVRALLGERATAGAVVLGYAETATGLGHAVADGLGTAPYLHSTRREVPGVDPGGGFEEEHSHATGHLLLPEDPALLSGPGVLVLVDDEFSTGQTVLNTIRSLHDRHPRDRYVIVALTDMRSPADRARVDGFAADLGARLDVVALATGTVSLPEGILEKARTLLMDYEVSVPGGVWGESGGVAAGQDAAGVAGVSVPDGLPAAGGGPVTADGGAVAGGGHARRVELRWPAGVPDGGRHGFLPEHRVALEAALPAMGQRLAAALPPGARRVLVLGSEELMYAPLRLAQALQDALAGAAGRSAHQPEGADAGAAAGGGPYSGQVDRAGGGGGRPELAEGAGAGGGLHPELPDPPGAGTAWMGAAGVAGPVPGEPGGDGDVSRGSAVSVAFSTTTRSPVLAVDDPGYAIRTRIVFPAHDEPADDGSRERYAYNTAGFDAVVCVVDSQGDTPALHAAGGLLAGLAAHTGAVLLAVVPSYRPKREPRTMSRTARTLPGPLRGPEFSSYAADEVGWLLKDLSGMELEAPTEEREEAVQSGGAHYAESLPVEYQPSAEYQELFRAALATSAERIARAVGAVTELVLAERGAGAVLVSLARAGTPVGVLMRRWARHAHGLELPHYAVSIVRGRGIDANALRWLAAHHDPADAVFVDGWTGKGAITRELAAAVTGFGGFNPEIAVLADPGGCVSTYGTRDDFLIPSACLNSTVSGLISRTVLRADLIGPDDFHGAKFYRELLGADVSAHFLDRVTRAFGQVAAGVAEDVASLRAQDRSPTWEGWAAVERISEEHGIHNVNLVKPGVGETTRVLLRRVPWKILARRGAGADLDHVRLLAAQRGVPVEETDALPYSCVGLIHPRYTRGATGADGKAVGAR